MPPTSTCLNKDFLKGYLFCLHHQSLTPTEAHKNLLEFTESEIFSLDDVTKLFEDITDGIYEMRNHDHLILADSDGKVDEKSVLEFLIWRYPQTFFSQLHTDLRKMFGGIELFDKRWINKLSENILTGDHLAMENYRAYNKDSLCGFLICLKIQRKTVQEAFSKLLEVTHHQVLSLEDVEELYKEVGRGHYLTQDLPEKKWLAVHQHHLMKKIVEFADLKTRKSLQQTRFWIRQLVNDTHIQIDCVHLEYTEEDIRIKSDPMIPEETFLNFPGCPGCVVKRDGKLMLDKTRNYKSHCKNALKELFRFDNLVVKEFRATLMEVEQVRQPREDMFNIFPRGELNIEILKLKTNNIQSFFRFMDCARSLKKVVISTTTYRGFAFRVFPFNWQQIDSLVTNQRFEEWRNPVNLNFSIFEMQYVVTLDRILAIKDALLLRPNVREIKITCEFVPDHYDEIQTRLGLYIPRGSRIPRWTRYPYPAPNEDKFLKLSVLDNCIWFKGPNWIQGELEKAEEELRMVEMMPDRVFENVEYYR